MAESLSMESRMLLTRAGVADKTDRRERLREALFGDRPLLEALILEIEGEPTGLCTFHTSFSTYRGQPGLFLEDLFVREGAREQGHGRRLMAFLAEVAEARGCYRILWNVPEDDKAVQRFYRNLGAKPVKESTMILKDKALTALAVDTMKEVNHDESQ
jgi:GNAT superfamily N-acetyltransferase